MATPLHLGPRIVSDDAPVFIVAELSGNHNQSLATALDLVRAAAAAGADAVKLQTATADDLTLDVRAPQFQLDGTLWAGKTLYELYRDLFVPFEWHAPLRDLAAAEGLLFFSTPFSPAGVAFLDELDVVALKIASSELVDLPLIRAAAATGRPLILSTGMGSLAEIDAAVRAAREAGATELALLKCTAAYPAPFAEMNLRTIPHLRDAFDVVVGLSDHSAGVAASVAAVALGARVIEKHLTLSRAAGGPDAAFSLEPAEFTDLVSAIRAAEQALGRVCYDVGPREAVGRRYRRSLYVVRDVRAGQELTAADVRSIRPAGGLAPAHLADVLGRRARVDVARGTPLTWDLLA